MRALRFLLLIWVFSSSLALADQQVAPRNGDFWSGGSAQDLLNITHDPAVVSKDAGRDPERSPVANICRTKVGDYYREGEQGYDACMAELRSNRATAGAQTPKVQTN